MQSQDENDENRRLETHIILERISKFLVVIFYEIPVNPDVSITDYVPSSML